MTMKKTLCAIVAATALGLAACKGPQIHEVKDLTGDGIPDVILESAKYNDHGTWLFISQPDGSYIGAKKHGKYFKTNKGEVYAFDGKSYVKISNRNLLHDWYKKRP